MTIEDDEFDDLLSPFDASTIGFKIAEMADRVKAISPAVPGAEAQWFFEMDDQRYRVKLSLAEALPK